MYRKGISEETIKNIEETIRENPSVFSFRQEGRGEMNFEKNIPAKDGCQIHCRYRLSVYPDIHKAEVLILPEPAIKSEMYTAVMKWFLQQRNMALRNEYGISPEYKNYQGQLALDGMVVLRSNPERDIAGLLHGMERCLADDFPEILDIYFGIIPDGVRSKLTKEMEDYQKELGDLSVIGESQ